MSNVAPHLIAIELHDFFLQALNQNLLADKMSISLLLVVQSIKMLLNLKPDNRRRLVGEVVDQLVGVHGDGRG
jgi:hypothetical protein